MAIGRKVNYEKVNGTGKLAVGMANYYGVRFYVGEKLVQPNGEVSLATGSVSIPVKFLTDEYFDALIEGINTARNDFKVEMEAIIAKKRAENEAEIKLLEGEIALNEKRINDIREAFAGTEISSKYQNEIKAKTDANATLKAKIEKLLA